MWVAQKEIGGPGATLGWVGGGQEPGIRAWPSPVVCIRQLEPWPGQLDVLLADNKGEDLFI